MAGEETKLYEQVASLSVEKTNISEKLNAALHESQKLNAALNEANEKNTKLSKQVDFYRKWVGSPAEVQDMTEKFKRVFTEFDPWKSMADERGLFEQFGFSMKDCVNKLLRVSEKTLKPGTMKQASENAKLIAEYKELGSISELNRALNLLQKYTKLGQIDKLTESRTVSEHVLSQYKKLGTVEEVDKSLALLKKYNELGKVSELAQVCDYLENYAKLGKLSEIKQVFKVAEAYVRLGNPKSVVEKLKSAAIVKRDAIKEQKRTEAKKLAEEFSVSHSTAVKLLDKMSINEAKEVLGGTTEPATDNLRVNEDAADKSNSDKKVISIKSGTKSLAESLFKAIPKANTQVTDPYTQRRI